MLKTVLCVDIGTTSLKAGLFTADGEAVFLCRKSFSEPDSRFVSLQWMEALAAALEKLSSDQKSSICAICVSGAGPTVVLDNGLTYRWNENLPSDIKIPELAARSLFLPRIMALKSLFASDYAASSYVFSGPEFFIWQLTGTALTILPESRFKTAYWNNETSSACGIDAEKLPDFCDISSNAGKLCQSCAEKLKLCGEIPVFCGAPDFVVALIGTNTLEPGRLCDRAGSSEGFNFCCDHAFFADKIRTLPSVIPGLWNVSALSTESGRIFVEYKHRLEKEQGSTIEYPKLVEDALENPAGEGGKILNQILLQVKDSVEILKSALAAQGIEFPRTMTVTGGQAKNDLWMQMKADALGMTLEICNCPDSELTGDACAAWTGLGKYSSLKEAASKIVKVTKRFVPQNENI